MRNTLRGAVIALALAGATLTGLPLATVGTAYADGITFDFGNVAFGYRDGYWDKNHHWNKWHNTAHRKAYMKADGNQYHEWNHERDSDKGWHESEHDGR